MFAFVLLASTAAATATCDATPFTLKKPPAKVAKADIPPPVPKVQPTKPKPKVEAPKPKSRVLADCDDPKKK